MRVMCMKKISIFVLLIFLSVMTSGYSKQVAVKYNDFNVMFRGEVVANKKEAPVLTLKSVSSGLVCSGKPQVTEVMFLNYVNPAYNGIFGKAYLSCNDGSSLLINWKVKKMSLDKVNGTAQDAYGRLLSFYIDKNDVVVSKKMEQYKNDLSQKPILVDYRTNIKIEKPPVLIKDETPAPKAVEPVVKKEEVPQKVTPAVVKSEKKVQPKPLAIKTEKKVAPQVKPAVIKPAVDKVEKKIEKKVENNLEKSEPKVTNVVKKEVKEEKEILKKSPVVEHIEKVKNIEKPKAKEIPAVVKKEEKVSKNEVKETPKAISKDAQKEAPKAVEAEKNIVPVKSETKKTEDVKKQPEQKANVQVTPTPKEVYSTFTEDKQSEISELKKFKSNVEIKKEEEKTKNINDSPSVAKPGNVFSLKNTLLRFNFGYNVSNPAQKF